MVGLQAKRLVIKYLQQHHCQSQRNSCSLIHANVASVRYISRRSEDDELKRAITALAQRHNRYGYRRLHVLLRRQGLVVNVKKVHRLYKQLGLMVKVRMKKKIAATLRVPLTTPLQPNQVRSMDFVHNRLNDMRSFRCLNIIDDCTKQAVAIEADTTLPALRVIRVLQQLSYSYGQPKAIRS